MENSKQLNPQAQRKLASTYTLLILLIFAWGFSWPIAKIGLAYIPPFWFSAGRLVSATLTVFIITAFTGHLRQPRKKDISMILVVGLVQMALYQVLITVGVANTDANRAAVLAYMAPFFITPIAVIFYNESLSKMKVFGLFCGLLGIIVMFNPFTFDWQNTAAVMGNICMIIAAASLSIPMLFVRYTKWTKSPLELYPWQLLTACVPVLTLCFITDPTPHIEFHLSLFGSMFYCGVIATAFGYWCLTDISRKLPIIMSSICLLCIPLVGVASSNMLLGEQLTVSLICAIILIITGLGLVAFADLIKKKPVNKV